MADHFDDWKDIKNKSMVFNRPTKYEKFAFDIPDNVINKKLELRVRSLESFTKKYGEEGKKIVQIKRHLNVLNADIKIM